MTVIDIPVTAGDLLKIDYAFEVTITTDAEPTDFNLTVELRREGGTIQTFTYNQLGLIEATQYFVPLAYTYVDTAPTTGLTNYEIRLSYIDTAEDPILVQASEINLNVIRFV
ncbi:hypothetical protein B0G52_101429 [Cohnella sp. SGD-V74]|nr:hypothetical protein B0G52_101429 [Cohnella sp. SGD-V74]